MAIVVKRPNLKWSEKVYLPAIIGGMAITFRHLKNMLTGRTKVTMQYPEQKWDSHMPEHYRGAPALVKDEQDRIRCVACQLCEFICRSEESNHAISRAKMGQSHAGALPRRTGLGEGRTGSDSLRCLSALRVYLPTARDQNRAG